MMEFLSNLEKKSWLWTVSSLSANSVLTVAMISRKSLHIFRVLLSRSSMNVFPMMFGLVLLERKFTKTRKEKQLWTASLFRVKKKCPIDSCRREKRKKCKIIATRNQIEKLLNVDDDELSQKRWCHLRVVYERNRFYSALFHSFLFITLLMTFFLDVARAAM